ncbi:MAG TPA: MIP/aquaporin family protein [Thermoguttaceae bacterium]|nr:MIP/aquaporin family protein [Thermoguttaceae bacterium]
MNIFTGELVGTMVLILLGDGVVANVSLAKSKAQNGGWIVVAAGWGFAVAIGVYIAGWASGAHINPAVTIGLASIGELPWAQVPVYLVGQFLGAFLGAVLVWLAYLPHWPATSDTGAKLAIFCTGPAIRNWRGNLICEIIGTAVLLMGVLGILNTNNEIGSGVGPYAIGILVFSIGLSLGGPTGYAINPARDLAPRIAHALLPIAGKGDSDWGYAWVPIVGPLIGGVIGAVLYSLLFTGLTPIGGS